jgi:Beta-galactosidase, domain 3
LADKSSAYNYWVPQLPQQGTSPGSSSLATTASSIIVKSGYFVRTAYLQDELHLTADFNTTTAVEVIGAPQSAKSLFINDQNVEYAVDANKIWSTTVSYVNPGITLPNLKDLDSFPKFSRRMTTPSGC